MKYLLVSDLNTKLVFKDDGFATTLPLPPLHLTISPLIVSLLSELCILAILWIFVSSYSTMFTADESLEQIRSTGRIAASIRANAELLASVAVLSANAGQVGTHAWPPT